MTPAHNVPGEREQKSKEFKRGGNDSRGRQCPPPHHPEDTAPGLAWRRLTCAACTAQDAGKARNSAYWSNNMAALVGVQKLGAL